MLPFILSIPLSTAFASMSASKLKIPPIFLLALGCVLQTIGTALMAMLPVQVEGRMYGFEAILGIGLGLNIGSIVILTPNLITGKDQCKSLKTLLTPLHPSLMSALLILPHPSNSCLLS